jgi:hypothetical protein
VRAVLVDLGGGAAGPLTGGVASVVAQQAPPPGKGEEFGKASPVGLVVVLLLAVATVLLIRSMTKRIKRLPESFDPPAEPAAHPDGAAPDGADPPDPERADRDEAGPARGAAPDPPGGRRPA